MAEDDSQKSSGSTFLCTCMRCLLYLHSVFSLTHLVGRYLECDYETVLFTVDKNFIRKLVTAIRATHSLTHQILFYGLIKSQFRSEYASSVTEAMNSITVGCGEVGNCCQCLELSHRAVYGRGTCTVSPQQHIEIPQLPVGTHRTQGIIS